MKRDRGPAIPTSTAKRRNRRFKPAAKVVMALAVSLGVLAPAVPSGAASSPSNLARNGPNLTLVVAGCPGPADNAVAEALAHHARNAAKVCIDPGGLSPETAALIADFAPDRVQVVGGEVAVLPAAMDELTTAARAAYHWSVVERLGGATRIETAALAARVALERPEVVGLDTATLIVANGWNGTDVRTAADVAAQTADAAVAYASPRTIADGLPDATASVIADYRPARVVIVGRADDVGSSIETAVKATLDAIGSTIEIERIAEAGEPRVAIPEASPSDEQARAIFTAIQRGVPRPAPVSGTSLPVLAMSKARGPSGEGERLWTARADGSERQLQSEDHRGWAWHPNDGRLSWSNVDGHLRVAGLAGDEQVLFEPGGYPTWSPDGRHVVAFRFIDTDGDGRSDSIEAHLAAADGSRLRRIGHVDYRTFLFSDLSLANWSPDGRRLAYVELSTDPESGEETSHARIETVDARTSPVTLGEDVTFLGWSPDGQRIAYATPSDCDGNERNESQNLWIASSDGSDARDLGFIDRIQWRLLHLWSPDGSHLAYESLDPTDCSMRLRVQTANGDTNVLELPVGSRFMGWSPNSTHLAYGITVGTAGRGVPLREHAWVVRRDGSDLRELGEIRSNVNGALLWSRDGNHVAYTQVLRDADGNVLGTRPMVQQSNGIGGAAAVEGNGNVLGWSPVDNRLAYVAHYDENGDGVIDRRALQLHTAGSLGAELTLVHELPDLTLGARWSPDGAYLGYGSGPTELILDWFINRRRGSDGWVVSTTEPRWTLRVVTDLAWGAWQPS
ncbi:hypothetical protein [Candidatus Poriferisodalis sp.]|uniref:hypothetical protein n=1 Tax=Candidatus Poriferisodalis sp. TaxID=3101277 RepID=UPI003B59ACD2